MTGNDQSDLRSSPTGLVILDTRGELFERVRANVDNEADEVMWGSPGTLLAAQAMLDSPVLQEMLTLMPSASQSCAACVTARAPPSLIAFRLTPRAALYS